MARNPLAPQGKAIPDVKEEKAGQEKHRNEEKFLRLHIGPQVDQEYPDPEGGVDRYKKEEEKLKGPAIGKEEMENDEQEDEDGRNPLEQPSPHPR
jgi:hypothetical protein